MGFMGKSFRMSNGSRGQPTNEDRLMARRGRTANTGIQPISIDAQLLEVNGTNAMRFTCIAKRSLFPYEGRPPFLLAPWTDDSHRILLRSDIRSVISGSQQELRQ
jgi:hypothetical protein